MSISSMKLISNHCNINCDKIIIVFKHRYLLLFSINYILNNNYILLKLLIIQTFIEVKKYECLITIIRRYLVLFCYSV